MRNKNIFILSLFVFLAYFSQSTAQEVQNHFPGKKWEVSKNPESLGFSKAKLNEAKKFADKLNTAAVMIVVDGQVLFQWGEVDRKYNTHSIRKSVLSALYGRYIKSGVIDMEATIADLGIDDREGLSEDEGKATIRDLLKSRSGVYHPALYESAGMKRRKPERFSVQPGTFWYYNNWDFNVLGTVFEKKTKKRVFEAIEEEIALPTGMEYYSSADGTYISGKESKHRAYPFRITAGDLARFGWLMLNEGNWNGEQVIDADWVRESTRYHSDATLYGSSGYGYMWWVARKYNKHPFFPNVDLPEDSYSAEGAGGHYLVIIPSLNMVIVHRVDTDISGNRVSKSNVGTLLKMILESKIENN